MHRKNSQIRIRPNLERYLKLAPISMNKKSKRKIFKVELLNKITRRVKPLTEFISEVNFDQLTIQKIDENFWPLNPSILSDASGIMVRTINQKLDINYRPSPIWPLKTINYWLDLTEKKCLKKLEQPNMPFESLLWKNWEDIRVFYWKNEIYLLFTTYEADEYNIGAMGLAPLTRPSEYVILRGHEDYFTQKNWSPLIFNNTLYFIYSWHPFIVLKYSEKDKPNCQRVKSIENSGGRNCWKGSTPCLILDELSTESKSVYLTLVHESKFPYYKSRFVLLSYHHEIGFEIQKWSKAFYFKKYRIEFPAGLARENDILTISFGFEDCECWLAKLSLKAVLKFLS